MFSDKAVTQIINSVEPTSLLDIGSGSGSHARHFSIAGFEVETLDFGTSVYAAKSQDAPTHVADFLLWEPSRSDFGVVWASHVLEHQVNPGLFLQKCRKLCRTGGVVALTVPPLKHAIVGGHVTLWNAGLLIYQLVMAGFDCSSIRIKSYGYNISAIVEKPTSDVTEHIANVRLDYDKGDIERLAEFFPAQCRKQGFNGQIKSLNWK